MPRTDFDGDGRDDIIWDDLQTGAVSNWRGQANGGFVYNAEAGEDLNTPGPLVGIGDFDGDGRSDTLWRDALGGLHVSNTYEGGAFALAWSLGSIGQVSAEWQVAGTGNFDGVGGDEILWRHQSGAVMTWTNVIDYLFVPVANATPGADWHIVGTGDFNGDGRDDVLWRNDNGDVTSWLGKLNGSFQSNFENAYYQVDNSWHIAGTGDFNGDGRDDILWRHESGAVLNWLGQSNGGFVSNANAYAGTDWRVVGVGDYNGDGRSDVLWRSEDGEITNWLGQQNGSFASNFENAYYQVAGYQQTLPNPSGFGEWDYW